MERRSTFRFRLPWSQPAPAPTPASKPSTQPTTKTSRAPTTRTGSRAASQPSSSSTPTATPSSSPTTENPTRKQPPSATSTTTSAKPSSPAQPSAGTQGRNDAPTSTTTPISTSPTPLPQPSAEMNAPSQPFTRSTSPLTETIPVPPQPSAESKAPIQLSTTSTSPLIETTPIPPQPSAESKAPNQPSTSNSTPANAPASSKSETQTPTTTISTTPTSTIAQSGPSSPPGVSPSPSSQIRESRTESQPLIPSQEQQGISSKPASPSDVSTIDTAPQSREMNPISSPTRKDPQVLSMDQLTSKVPPPASQSISSNLPSGINSQMQQKDQTIAQPTSPLKQLDSSEPSSKSTEALTSIYGKEPKLTAIQPQSEQMGLPKKEIISDTEAKVRSPEKIMQPLKLSEVKSTRGITEEPSQISDSSGINGKPKMVTQSETNIQETREVKEVVQEMRDKNYGAGENIGGFLTSKKQPASSDNNQIRVNPVSNRKHTTVLSQPKNKTVASSSSKETAVSTEQDIPLNKEVKDNISKFIHRMAVGEGKQNLEEGPVSVITLAGDNRGASMQLGSDSSRKEGAIHIRRGYKLNPDESADATTDAEGNSEGRRPKDARTMEDQEIEAYLNCNVQGMNNSITFDSAIEAKNPGIHMLFPRMSSEPIRSSDTTGPFEAHKAEFSVTPAQKLTYEPKIRRRCLKGVLEPSDSDPDNPGCHVGCMEKSNDNEIEIL